MRKNELVKSMNLTFSEVGFRPQKKSPEVLVTAGVVGVVMSAVMACQTIPKAPKVAEKTDDDIDRIQNTEESGMAPVGGFYTQENARSDHIRVHSHTGFQYVELHAPAAPLGAASITYILTSHKILRKRNMALTAAYAMLGQPFKDYRGRVPGRFGEQMEKELRYNLKAREIEATVVDEGGKEKKVKEAVDVVNEGWDLSKCSPYARIFGEGRPAYMRNAEQNRFYLLVQRSQANGRLKSHGHLFLNETYEMPGLPLTKAGVVMGWIHDDKEPMGDNSADFSILEVRREKTVDFVNEHECSFVLDFNVVGDTTDVLATHQILRGLNHEGIDMFPVGRDDGAGRHILLWGSGDGSRL